MNKCNVSDAPRAHHKNSAPPRPLRAAGTSPRKTDLYRNTSRPRQQTQHRIQKSGSTSRHKLRRSIAPISANFHKRFHQLIVTPPLLPLSFQLSPSKLRARMSRNYRDPKTCSRCHFICSSRIPYALDVPHNASLSLLLASASRSACACSPPRTRPAVGRIMYCRAGRHLRRVAADDHDIEAGAVGTEPSVIPVAYQATWRDNQQFARRGVCKIRERGQPGRERSVAALDGSVYRGPGRVTK